MLRLAWSIPEFVSKETCFSLSFCLGGREFRKKFDFFMLLPQGVEERVWMKNLRTCNFFFFEPGVMLACLFLLGEVW
jgi:hypothetical protein